MSFFQVTGDEALGMGDVGGRKHVGARGHALGGEAVVDVVRREEAETAVPMGWC